MCFPSSVSMKKGWKWHILFLFCTAFPTGAWFHYSNKLTLRSTQDFKSLFKHTPRSAFLKWSNPFRAVDFYSRTDRFNWCWPVERQTPTGWCIDQTIWFWFFSSLTSWSCPRVSCHQAIENHQNLMTPHVKQAFFLFLLLRRPTNFFTISSFTRLMIHARQIHRPQIYHYIYRAGWRHGTVPHAYLNLATIFLRLELIRTKKIQLHYVLI